MKQRIPFSLFILLCTVIFIQFTVKEDNINNAVKTIQTESEILISNNIASPKTVNKNIGQNAMTVPPDQYCVSPEYVLYENCNDDGNYTFNSSSIMITNLEAFTGNILPGNISGFEVYIDYNDGNGYTNSGIIISNVFMNTILPTLIYSGVPVDIQLVGIDLPFCTSEPYSLDFSCSCANNTPVNDDCLNAIPLAVLDFPSCNNFGAPYTLSCATVDILDPDPSCFSSGNNANVWFSFVAPCSGHVQISTDYFGGNLNDTEIALFSGFCGNLTEISCDEDSGVNIPGNSIISINDLIAGETYYIMVDRGATAPDESFCIDVIDLAPVDTISNIVVDISFEVDTVFNGDSLELVIIIINNNPFDVIIDSIELYVNCDSTIMELDSTFRQSNDFKDAMRRAAPNDTIHSGDTIFFRLNYHAWVIIIDDWEIATCCFIFEFVISHPNGTCSSTTKTIEICIDVVIAACPQILFITMPMPSGVYEADDIIYSITTVSAQDGGPIAYQAGANAGGTEFIELGIGFDATGEVDFLAENVECDPSD